MRPIYDSVIRIGSQEIIPLGDYLRFVIDKVLPCPGFKFRFGIRKRIIDEVTKRGKRLEVRFNEFPDISFNLNPIQWLNLGELKKEVKLFKNSPMQIYYFYVGFNGELVTKRQLQPVGQEVLSL